MRKASQWMLCMLLLVLAIGQIPTGIGRNFLILAILAAPLPVFQEFLDWLLSHCSWRRFLTLLCLVCIIKQPEEEYRAAGRQMAQFLYGICEIFNLL